MISLFDLVSIGMFLLLFFLFLALMVAAIRWLWYHAKD
nr:MAG TPA: GRB2-binding adapter (GAPT) [Microviridae sp.]